MTNASDKSYYDDIMITMLLNENSKKSDLKKEILKKWKSSKDWKTSEWDDSEADKFSNKLFPIIQNLR